MPGTYRVLYSLVHDHVRSEPGASVELSEECARPLLADGVIDGPLAGVASDDLEPISNPSGKFK